MTNKQERFNWTFREELMCLVIYKKLKEKVFQRGLRTKFCGEMSLKDNTPPYNSINLKVGNYEFLFTRGKKGASSGAKNPLTKIIYENFKDQSTEKLQEMLKQLEKK